MRALALVLALAVALLMFVLVVTTVAAAGQRQQVRQRRRARWGLRHYGERGETVVAVSLMLPGGRVLDEHVVARISDASRTGPSASCSPRSMPRNVRSTSTPAAAICRRREVSRVRRRRGCCGWFTDTWMRADRGTALSVPSFAPPARTPTRPRPHRAAGTAARRTSRQGPVDAASSTPNAGETAGWPDIRRWPSGYVHCCGDPGQTAAANCRSPAGQPPSLPTPSRTASQPGP